MGSNVMVKCPFCDHEHYEEVSSCAACNADLSEPGIKLAAVLRPSCVAAPVVKKVNCQQFGYDSKHQVTRKVLETGLFGRQTGKEIEVTRWEYKYPTPLDLLQAAVDFVQKIPPEDLISVSGGEDIYTQNGARYGGVIVWYRQ